MQSLRFLMVAFLLLLLTSCAERLPQRSDLSATQIPALSEGNGRLYIFMGYMHLNEIIDTTQRLKGIDGQVFINDQYVSYINAEESIIVDIPEGKNSVHWVPIYAMEVDQNNHGSIPYEISVSAGDEVYLEANFTNPKDNSALAVLGGVGGAIAGAATKYADYFEEEPVKGKSVRSTTRVGDYIDLSK